VVVHRGEEWCVMVDTVEGRLAALEARMAAVEGCSREVMRTVGIRFEEPAGMIAQMEEVAAIEGGVLVVEGEQDGVVIGRIEALADSVDDAEGVEAPGLVVVDEAGRVDLEGLVGSEPAAETLSGGEG
jgi:hypothetical protein